MNKVKKMIKELKKKPEELYFEKKEKTFKIFEVKKLLSKPQRGAVDNIIQAMLKKKTTRILNLSQTETAQGIPIKTAINRNDYFFTEGMSFKEQSKLPIGWRRGDVIGAGYRRFFRDNKIYTENKILTYRGKRLSVGDWTTLIKRSRAIYEGHDGMEFVGKVYDGRLKKPVTGYGVLFTGFPTSEGFTLYDSSLYSNTYMNEYPEDFGSMNDLEYQTIERLEGAYPAEEILFIGDSHFSAKNTLTWLKYDKKIDFLMRIDSDVNVTYKKEWGNVITEAERIKDKHIVYWKEKDGEKIKCEGVYFTCNLFCEKRKQYLYVTIIYLRPVNWKYTKKPMILVTSLSIKDDDLQEVVNLYKYRWQIETAIEYLKQNFGLEKIMLQHWEAIKSMISFVLWVSLILFICFKILLRVEILIELIKKFTVLKNNELTWGKTIWFYTYLYCGDTMPLRNIEKFI